MNRRPPLCATLRLAAGLACCCSVACVAAADVWVIAADAAPVGSLSRAEVAALYLNPAGNPLGLVPLDRDDAALRERFYRRSAGLSPASVRAHWAKQVFTGRGRPPAMLAGGDIVQTLRQNPRAVTYVEAGELHGGSKTLLILESGGAQ